MSRPSPARRNPDGTVDTDVAIVGAGVTGLYAAVTLPGGLDTVIVDKGRVGRSGSSPWAQGGVAAAVGEDDSPEQHAADTLAAGDGLGDPAAAGLLADETPGHIDRLLALGAQLDARGGGRATRRDQLHLAREGGHTVARSVHATDATGAELVRTLRRAATPRVTRLEGTVVSLSTDRDARVTGLWTLTADGPVAVRARAVLLATGGCGGLFAATTNRDGSTADGLALATAAGAAARDLEFVQFHPTGLATSGTHRLLLTEALRGAGATLRDADGERLMADRHPDGDLAPRHVVTRAICEHDGQVWLDATDLGAERLAAEFPTALGGAREHGFDLAGEPVPVTPAAHYMVGGVRTDLHGRTSRPGLYAAGEIASTGLHGANRMAGNSLAEALVFGARAARALLGDLPERAGPTEPPTLAVRPDRDLAEARRRLRRTMWDRAGPVRSGDGLRAGADGLAELQARLGAPSPDRGHAELVMAVSAARLMVASALRRRETRGGHVRTDHPDPRPDLAGVHLEHTAPLPGPG